MAPTDTAFDVARSYHDAWTSKQFADAASLLAPDLKVEVPVNDYPTRESFAEALAAFGGLATRVELLCELGYGAEAMLLYDMDVEGLGRLRVAEHFTVADEHITRLRQIHDTAALRSAGFVQ
jgi:ketosteroid isomerase-like protein